VIRSLHIEGYRGFESFDMEGLGRINLLVGDNNSGKTSVLEAIHLLVSLGDPSILGQILSRRGERLYLPDDRNERNFPGSLELDVRHLFYGHEADLGSKVVFSAQAPTRSISFVMNEISDEGVEKQEQEQALATPARTVLSVTGMPPPLVDAIPLSSRDGLLWDPIRSGRFRKRQSQSELMQAQYISTESLSARELIGLWESITLTSSEELVLKALGFLDPRIERLASQSSVSSYGLSRAGFKVKIRGNQEPIPIGSLGDGLWRLLAVSIAITQCRKGVLLVDEIDTGLHYTVMSDMWKLIYETAKELDVQVFATTHSADCIKSLASICRDKPDSDDRVTLQRIEIGKRKPVAYSENEIRESAWDWVEVR
jgi:hypothetical protein